MAFWGVCVKPEEPYTLKPGGGRLRISQATLADQCETPVPRSVLQCAVGNRPPILVCSLSMKEIHCCQLDLQFEEPEDVIFSVSGPRGVHLSGYYLTPSPTVIVGTSPTGLDDFTIDEANCKGAEIEKGKKMIYSEEDIGDTDSFGDGSDEENAYYLSDSFIDDSAAKPLEQQEHPKVGENHASGAGKMAVHKRGSGRAVHKRESGATFICGLMDNHDDMMINGELERTDDMIPKKKKKKKKRKIRTEGKEENMMSKRKKLVTKFEGKHMDAHSSKARTLLDGIIVEDLAMGDPCGKIAAPRSKVKIMYTAWVKETGEFIESNRSRSPIKFRLGDEEIIEGWNVGIEGMRVGGKRRLILSPSMGSWGIAETHPLSNSWLVYDVELVSVR